MAKQKAPAGMYSRLMRVTPALAAEWLAKSAGNPRWANKKFDLRRVAAIKRDILAGRWHPGNNSIAFDLRGVLVDGHHRLKAIVEAETAVESLVCFNVTEAGLKHIDDNAARKPSQILQARMPYTSLFNLYAKVSGNSCDSCSIERLSALLDRYAGELDAVYPLFGKGSAQQLTRNAPYYLAVFSAYVCGVEYAKLERFAQCLNTGFIDGPSESAAVACRNQLLLHPPHSNMERIQAAKNIQAALHDFCEGRERKRPYSAANIVYPISE